MKKEYKFVDEIKRQRVRLLPTKRKGAKSRETHGVIR